MDEHLKHDTAALLREALKLKPSEEFVTQVLKRIPERKPGLWETFLRRLSAVDYTLQGLGVAFALFLLFFVRPETEMPPTTDAILYAGIAGESYQAVFAPQYMDYGILIDMEGEEL